MGVSSNPHPGSLIFTEDRGGRVSPSVGLDFIRRGLPVRGILTQVSTALNLVVIPTPFEYESDVTVLKKYCYRNNSPHLTF